MWRRREYSLKPKPKALMYLRFPMALSNAEKQKRYRARVKTERVKMRRIIIKLRAEIHRLNSLLEVSK